MLAEWAGMLSVWGLHPELLLAGAAGGGAAHENRMPYFVVYFWQRTA